MSYTTPEFEFPGDYSKEQNVKVFVAKPTPNRDGKNQLKKSIMLLSYKYIPIIPEAERNKLYDIYDDSPILFTLLDQMDFLFNFLHQDNIDYFSNRKVSCFNVKNFLEKELEFYRSATTDVESYPIFKHIDNDTLQNINFIGKIKTLMEIAERQNISDFDKLQFGEDINKKDLNIKTPDTKEFNKLKNCVINIFHRRFDDFLEEQLNNELSKIEDKSNTNKHENIFCNNGFELFEYLLEYYISKRRGKYEDISYFYRRLFKDNYIHQKPTPFKEWYNELFNEDIEKIKTTKQSENENRIKHYQLSLDWFKQQK